MLLNFSRRNVAWAIPLLLSILLAIFLIMSVIQASAMNKETTGRLNLSHCNAFAKWFHSEEFSDLYPKKTFKELHDQFLPIEANGFLDFPSRTRA